MQAREFGERLGEALEAAGFSKLRFVRLLQDRRQQRKARGEPPLRKVDRPALYAFLDGRDLPPVDTAAEMADILGVRLAWLAEGEEPLETGLPAFPPPIWLVVGREGPWRGPNLPARLRARRIFQESFLSRADGFAEADPVVRVAFVELLGRRLARRRAGGGRTASDAAYRASTAWGLYLKCFLDVMAELPSGTGYASREFTRAFLSRLAGWIEDEVG